MSLTLYVTFNWCVKLTFLSLLLPYVSGALKFHLGPSTQLGVRAEICGAPGYDVNNLTRADYWQFQHTGKCLGGNATTTCTYMMTFCKQLVLKTPVSECSNASICQQSGSETMKLGAYTHNPFHVNATTNGFVASFLNGSSYHDKSNKTCNISVLINLECNSKAVWKPVVTHSAITPSTVPVPVDVHYFPSTCLYIVKADYAGACYKLTPASVDWIASPGTVILLIFFASFVVYFLGGLIVNGLRGEKGANLLPNSEFWVMLPIWISAGCVFTFKCQACKETSSAYDSI